MVIFKTRKCLGLFPFSLYMTSFWTLLFFGLDRCLVYPGLIHLNWYQKTKTCLVWAYFKNILYSVLKGFTLFSFHHLFVLKHKIFVSILSTNLAHGLFQSMLISYSFSHSATHVSWDISEFLTTTIAFNISCSSLVGM